MASQSAKEFEEFLECARQIERLYAKMVELAEKNSSGPTYQAMLVNHARAIAQVQMLEAL